MTASSTSSVSPDQPSRRREIGPFRLAFGLLAAPLAWSADELFSYGAASQLCRMKASGSGQTLTVPDSPWLWGVVVVTLVIAVAGFVVAVGNWRKARDELAGSGRHLLEPGEGHSRFIAMCGVLTSSGFLIAFLFMLANLILAPLCGQ